MNLRITLAHQLFSLGAFLQTLPVAILRPVDMAEWARVRYDRQSAMWNTQNDPDVGLTRDEQALWEYVPRRAGRMLILGGGGGRKAIFFARQGWQVTALDISEGMLTQAHAAMQARGLELRTIRGDLADFTAPAQSFDAVWTSMFLYSLVLGRARCVAMLRRLRALLTPGGWLGVSFHFDPRARVSAKTDRARRWLARLTFGNRDYQNGDLLFGTLEFRHAFAAEAELRAEFAASGFGVAYLTAFEGMMRGEPCWSRRGKETLMSNAVEIQHFPLWDKLKDKRMPLSFDLEITARCNNACRHCYINLPVDDVHARAQELTVAEISGITDQAIKLGAMWCLITGGEPLLRSDFAEIYLALKRKGLLVSVFTNATTIRGEHLALWKKYPPRDIQVTVYGVTRETYERVTCKPGSFDAFMRGLDALFASGVRVRLKAMALQSNLSEFDAIAKFCRARTKDFYRFDPQLHLRFDGDAARNVEIRAERLTPEQIVALELADGARFAALCAGEDKLINSEFNHIGCDHLFHCGAGNGSFNVSYDGKFRLCSSLWAEGTTYDLRTGTLADAWNEFVPRVRDLRSRKREFLETCRQCAIVNLCLWCPAHAHLETGEMDGATPYFCAVAHARAEAIQGK